MVSRNEFAEILKQARLSAGLTQREAAEAVGKKQQTLASWEIAQSQPDANTLFMLCELYGVSIDEAFGFKYKKRLTPEELELLKLWRDTTEEGQRAALAVLQSCQKDTGENKGKKVIRIAARGGGVQDIELTEEQHQALLRDIEAAKKNKGKDHKDIY